LTLPQSTTPDPDATLTPPVEFVPSRRRKEKLYETVYLGEPKEQPDLVVAAMERVSSPKQEREGYGLEAQHRLILTRMTLEYVTKLGLYVEVHVYRDVQQRDANVLSKRPMLDQLVRDIPLRGIKHVWCVRIDRFEGDGGEMYGYTKTTVKLAGASFFHTELERGPFDPEGRHEGLLGYIKADEAKAEKGKILDRTAEGRATRVAKGMTPGANTTFGLAWQPERIDGKLRNRVYQTPHPTERVIVREIFLLYRDVVRNLRKLADALNEQQKASPSGGKWSASTVGYLLRNEAYIGIGYKNKTNPETNAQVPRSHWVVVPNSIRPDADGNNVVDDELFHDVQALLDQRGTGGRPRIGREFLLGGGYCRCAYCGLTMTGTVRGPNERAAGLRQYVCRNKQVDSPCYAGTGPSVNDRKVEDALWSAVVAMATNRERVAASFERLRGEAGPTAERALLAEQAIAETQANIANWQASLKDLDPDLQGGIIGDMNKAAARLRALRAEQAAEATRAAALRGELVDLEAWLGDLAELDADADALFGVDEAARRSIIERFKVVIWVRKASDPEGRFSVRAHVPLPRSASLTEAEAGGEVLRVEPTNGVYPIGQFSPPARRRLSRDPLNLDACLALDLTPFVAFDQPEGSAA
jgi:DNA invertase Pin-like site-specific DNA recombinase